MILRLTAIGAIVLIDGCDSSGTSTNVSQLTSVDVLVSDSIDVRGGAGFYVNADDGVRKEIRFALPADRINVSYFHDVERIGRSGAMVAVLDTYGSRTSGGRCSDGREAWLRIFSLTTQRQVEAIPVESCMDRIKAGTPPVVWRGDGFDVGSSHKRRFAIEGDRVRALDDGKIT